MPVSNMDNQKAKSPSPNVQRGVDEAWGQQNANNTTAQKALADKHTKNPVKVGK